MTITDHRQIRIAITTLALLAGCAGLADRLLAQAAFSCTASSCVPMTLNAALQLTMLHPSVTHVQVQCTGTVPTGSVSAISSQMPVVNRGYTGTAAVTLQVPLSVLATATDHAIAVSCKLQIVKAGGTATQSVTDAVATAAQPVVPAFDNWAVLGTDATVKWTQTVAFPNVNVAP